MRCDNCGYEDRYIKFKRGSMAISSSAAHYRICPKCGAASICDPIMEDIMEERKKERDKDKDKDKE